jgi:hypothetical protein
MKKALINFAIIGLILSIFAVSCKKYPEDEYLLTLRSTLNRIKGSKKIEYAYSQIDSTDILSIYEEKFGPFYLYFSDIFHPNQDVYYVYIINSDTHKLTCLATYDISSDNESFQLLIDRYSNNPCFSDSESVQLPFIDIYGDILKCDKNELVLSHAKFSTYAP